MRDIILSTARETQIKVHGDMIGCTFSGQNLHPDDVTSISVDGQIFNRAVYNFRILDQSIQNIPYSLRWDAIFGAAMNADAIAKLVVPDNLAPAKYADFAFHNAGLFLSGNPGFVYDPVTRRLGFSGQMSDTVADALSMPLTILRYGKDGRPQVDPVTHHFLTD